MSIALPTATTYATFGPASRRVEVGSIAVLAEDAPMLLDCGIYIERFPVAFQTYGTLNAERSNAILVCHGLTGDQYAQGTHPVTGKPGWWQDYIGPGLPIDTDRFFVIATNVIGGCMGSHGPKDISPVTGKAYGRDFPMLTIADMVRAQKLFLERLGIARLFAVVGGSMGGMQALEWMVRYPECVFAAMPIATAARHPSQNIAFHEIGRQAIMADPEWRNGRYAEEGTFPAKGLSVARMAAHITYLSEEALHEKFGRRLQDREAFTFGFDADFQIESYLRHQGQAFVERFDPTSDLYITRAMDYFDLARDHGGSLAEALRPVHARVCLVSFSSDWLFTAEESRHIARALNANAAKVSFVEIDTPLGHDAFLLDVAEFKRTMRGFLDGAAREAGL